MCTTDIDLEVNSIVNRCLTKYINSYYLFEEVVLCCCLVARLLVVSIVRLRFALTSGIDLEDTSL